MEGMVDKGKNVKGLQKKIAEACKKAGLDHHIEGKENNIMYTLGKKVCHYQGAIQKIHDTYWHFSKFLTFIHS